MSRCVYPLFDSRKESSFTSSWRKISTLEILISLFWIWTAALDYLLFLGGPQSSYVSLPLFFFLLIRKREREDENTPLSSQQQQQQQQQCSDNLQSERERETKVCVCVHACCVWTRLDDDFFWRESFERVISSSLKKSIRWRFFFFSFLSLSVPQFGWRIFFARFGQERKMNFCIFFTKNCKERQREERRAEERQNDEKRENGKRREEERVR